ncbi:MAG: winged helix-turn-helix transcriptional regulator [Halobellus sp.]|uniref:winged helix-turn-helix transcriptional regulator n=1 Tax=Halobellus sp. TaxID=1979212 RepID=UPI0035D4F580
MSKSDDHSAGQKSLRQWRILDLAAEEPGASFAEIAERVPSATADLVEYVLEEYGDPAASEGASTTDSADGETAADETDDATDDKTTDGQSSEQPPEEISTESQDNSSAMASSGSTPEKSASSPEDSSSAPTLSDPNPETEEEAHEGESAAADRAESALAELSPEALSTKERETLRAIYERPSATQREIAEALDVSRATVSNRIRGIEGFEWADRQSLVSEAFDGDGERSSAADNRAIADGPSPDGSASDSNVESTYTADADSSGGSNSTIGTNASIESNSTVGSGNNVDSDSTADSEASATSDSSGAAVDPGNAARLADSIEELSTRLAAVEERFKQFDPNTDSGARESDSESSADPSAGSPSTSDSTSGLDDPELVHKVIRACVHDDEVTEDEERRIVGELLDS